MSQQEFKVGERIYYSDHIRLIVEPGETANEPYVSLTEVKWYPQRCEKIPEHVSKLLTGIAKALNHRPEVIKADIAPEAIAVYIPRQKSEAVDMRPWKQQPAKIGTTTVDPTVFETPTPLQPESLPGVILERYLSREAWALVNNPVCNTVAERMEINWLKAIAELDINKDHVDNLNVFDRKGYFVQYLQVSGEGELTEKRIAKFCYIINHIVQRGDFIIGSLCPPMKLNLQNGKWILFFSAPSPLSKEELNEKYDGLFATEGQIGNFDIKSLEPEVDLTARKSDIIDRGLEEMIGMALCDCPACRSSRNESPIVVGKFEQERARERTANLTGYYTGNYGDEIQAEWHKQYGGDGKDNGYSPQDVTGGSMTTPGELKTFTPIHHYMITTAPKNKKVPKEQLFIDLLIEADDTAESIYLRLSRIVEESEGEVKFTVTRL